MKKRCLLTKINSKGTLIGERERERECVYWDGGAKSSHDTKILLKIFSSKKGEHNCR